MKTVIVLRSVSGATFISLIVENRHGNNDVHNVPSFAKENQAKNIMDSIKLV